MTNMFFFVALLCNEEFYSRVTHLPGLLCCCCFPSSSKSGKHSSDPRSSRWRSRHAFHRGRGPPPSKTVRNKHLTHTHTAIFITLPQSLLQAIPFHSPSKSIQCFLFTALTLFLKRLLSSLEEESIG